MQLNQIDVIFDNAMGAQLQTNHYVHKYLNTLECAEDVFKLLKGDDPREWDGNEPENRLEYSLEMASAGCYHWFDRDDILNPSKKQLNKCHNVKIFFAHLKKLNDDFLKGGTP